MKVSVEFWRHSNHNPSRPVLNIRFNFSRVLAEIERPCLLSYVGKVLTTSFGRVMNILPSHQKSSANIPSEIRLVKNRSHAIISVEVKSPENGCN